MELGQHTYPGRGVEQGVEWLKWLLNHPDRLVLVGPNSGGVAEIVLRFGYERKPRMVILGGRPWEVLRILRMVLDWCAERGVSGPLMIDSDTGYDFGPYARRLGGRSVHVPRYEIPIRGD